MILSLKEFYLEEIEGGGHVFEIRGVMIMHSLKASSEQLEDAIGHVTAQFERR